MEIRIVGTPEEIKKLFQTIGSSEEQSEIPIFVGGHQVGSASLKS